MARPASVPPRIDARALTPLSWAVAADDLGAAAGRPVVIVELDGDDQPAWTPGAHPVVVVGLREPGWSGTVPAHHPCDVVVAADDPALEELVEGVEGRPLASTSLAVLLRRTAQVDVEAGLASESAVYSMLQSGPEFAAWLATRGSVELAPEPRPPIRSERRDSRLVITLDRPHRHNAVTESMRAELASALLLPLVDDTITAVELRGAGPSFCSGGDLAEFGTFPDPARAHVSRLTRSVARLMHMLRDRLVVHLHGACVGAGIELPAFAKRVVAEASTVISLPEVTLGLIPGAGGTVSLPARIGRHRTAILALTARQLDAADALRWGLVDEIA